MVSSALQQWEAEQKGLSDFNGFKKLKFIEGSVVIMTLWQEDYEEIEKIGN